LGDCVDAGRPVMRVTSGRELLSFLILRRRCIEREAVVEEDVPGPLVDRLLRHPGPLHHVIERAKVLLDEGDDLQRVALDAGKWLAEAFDAAEVRKQAKGHHRERLGAEVAEVEPVGPNSWIRSRMRASSI